MLLNAFSNLVPAQNNDRCLSPLKIHHLEQTAGTHLGAGALEQAQGVQCCISYVKFCIHF